MIRAFRLCKTRHIATAFSGEGARINGGRWNSPGQAVVYTSATLSLATLEVLVHLEDPAVFTRLFSWISVEIPDPCIERLDPRTLDPTWTSDETNIHSRTAGDAWLRSMRSAVLAVPSVVTPGEWNYLINPLHHQFATIVSSAPEHFRPDPRLVG
jgi:RES domain-containing protein